MSNESSKLSVPDWETKMQTLQAYVKPDKVSSPEEYDSNEEKEEWMLMAELNVQTVDKECMQSLTPLCWLLA